MTLLFTCDHCGKSITDRYYATLQIAGRQGSEAIHERERHFHTDHYEGSRDTCYRRMMNMLDGAELDSPSGGFEWKLVPVRERFEDCAQVLGTTPLSELEIDKGLFGRLYTAGIRTIEHAADLRDRNGTVLGLGPTAAMRLDQALDVWRRQRAEQSEEVEH